MRKLLPYIIIFLCLSKVTALSTDQSATFVLGQISMTVRTVTRLPTTTSLLFPVGMEFDDTNRLIVADRGNNRVLRYDTILATASVATLVLGQPNFTSHTVGVSTAQLAAPSDVAIDSSGNVWVADTGNNRVVRFSTPCLDGADIDLVLGQSTFLTNDSSTEATGMHWPVAIDFDQENSLWVVDQRNNRMLKFETPISSGMEATIVVGGGLYIPSDFEVVSSSLIWVTDKRLGVVKFVNPISSTSLPSLTLWTPGIYGSTKTFSNAYGVAIDTYATPNLWVADTDHRRVLKFDDPVAAGANPSIVIGQADDVTFDAGLSDSRLNKPFRIRFSTTNFLFVSDTFNNRILVFE